MSLITTAVKFTVLPADGVPIAGLRVRAELTRPDVDGGVLVPQPRARGDTDANGQCTIHLWPNSRGTNASQYRVKVYQGTELIHNFLITVPEQSGVVLAETIINQAPYPAVDAAQAAVTAAQAAAAEAANASRLTIGTVTTLDPGEDATAEIVGDPGEQTLNLGLPRGAGGEGGEGGGAVTSVAGRTGDVVLAKADVGLGNVDNTADASKPVSTAQAEADTAVLNAAAADATAKANAAAAASDPAGTAATAVGNHVAATDPHGDRAAAAVADAEVLASANAYADALVVGLLDDRGNYNASGNTFPSSGGSGAAGAVLKGDLWTVSVAGTLGGVAVAVGDQVRALVNAPGQTAGNWAISEANIGYVPVNSADKDATGGFPGLSGFSIKLKNALGTVTSLLASAATAARTWTFPDKDGTVAMLSDITAANAGAIPTGGLKTINGNALEGSGDLTVSASPGGSTTQVQYNNAGAFAGNSAFTFDSATGKVTATKFAVASWAEWAAAAFGKSQMTGSLTMSTDLGWANGFGALSGGSSLVTVAGYSTTPISIGGNSTRILIGNTAGQAEINNGTAGTYRDLKLRNLIASGGVVTLASFTVATLPSASTSGAGAQAFVTDANATTARSTVAGGGSNKVNVFSDGTNWLIAA